MIPLSRIDVSPSKEKQFQSKHLTSVEELATFFPRKYMNFSKLTKIRDLEDGSYVRISGTILRATNYDRVEVVLEDETGTIKLVWFGGCYFYDKMLPGTEWTFCGKVSQYGRLWNMSQPMLHAQGYDKLAGIYPIYSKIRGMSDEYLQTKIAAAMAVLEANRVWSEKDALAKVSGFPSTVDAMRVMHKPTDGTSWKAAKKRIVFDQLFDFYEILYSRKQAKIMISGRKFASGEKTESFIDNLPFVLTEDQRKAYDIIRNRTAVGESLNHLITGDVGCGKTMVALLAAMLAWENGYQSVIMAPTLVLAKQHYEEMSKFAAGTGMQFALLTSETKARERKKILADLAAGIIHAIIGTHSVLSSDLVFDRLGMTIIDEEHRFGTQQKQVMDSFTRSGAHHLSMTATPIPRSYAAAIYGNSVDIIAIETMPAGRKPVITQVALDEDEIYRGLLSEINAGHQAYVVCPFIEDSENEKFKDVRSVVTVAEDLTRWMCFNAPHVKVSYINGDMKQASIIEELDRFAAGKIDILVSTTIVEVGVNVPNATAIAIMNAERFGLSALHQLRGRVGRKGDQGYCYLMPDRKQDKLDYFCQHTSGFEISQYDMQLRGPGNLLGDEQTGNSEIVDLILRYPTMAASVRKYFEDKEDN